MPVSTGGGPLNDANATALLKQVPSTTFKARLVRRVTMPTVNPGINEPYFLKILDAFRVSTYVNPDPKKASEKPATICSVCNMATGEIALWLVGEVCVKNLEEQYPDAGYVNRIFAVQKLPKRPTKRYHDWEIAEVEEEQVGA